MNDQALVNMALRKGYLSPDQLAQAEVKRLALENRGVQTNILDILMETGVLKEDDAQAIRKTLSHSSLQALEIEGYVIEGRIGSGGMGDIFKGVNSEGHIRAVKLLPARYNNNAEYLRRFEREVRAAMRLDHPHIAKSYDSGMANGSHYILMEMVEGETLKSWIDNRGPLSEEHALTLLHQVVLALDYSWCRGVLHRDIKPANIIMGPARPGIDEPFCAKLIDFGLAKVWSAGSAKEESRGGLTGEGLALGTPHYMSPEQASGQKDLDQRCDIYGLGASLYHALLGHTLFSGKNSEIIMFKQISEEIDLSELRKIHIRSDVINLLAQMLVKNRFRRIGSWPLVLSAIQSIAEKKSLKKPSPTANRNDSTAKYVAEPASLNGIVPQQSISSAARAAALQRTTIPYRFCSWRSLAITGAYVFLLISIIFFYCVWR